MAEEEKKDGLKAISEADCKALYDLLVKKDLTSEEKNEVKTIVENFPQILAQEEFTKNFKLTDFASACSKVEDLPAALEQNSKDIERLNNALTNLKDYAVGYDDKIKNAAACLLDIPILENGELIGTQLAKNIHFLGTAKKNIATEPEDTKKAVDAVFNQNEAFYRSLYAKTGYGADRNACNFSGQKVEELMLECLALREGKAVAQEMAKSLADAAGSSFIHTVKNDKVKDDTIESVKAASFMAHPDKEAVEKGRKAVALKIKPFKEMSVDEIDAFRRLNALDVSQAHEAEQAKKEKTQADMENKLLDPHRPKKRDRREKFQEGDVIDYMYKEWFLEGLSWLFDKAEDLLEAALDKIIDARLERSARRAEAEHLAKSEEGKKLDAKLEAFTNIVSKKHDEIDLNARDKKTHFVNNLIAQLKTTNFNELTKAQENALKSKYGKDLIDHLKTEYAKPDGPVKVQEFLQACPQRYENMFKTANFMEHLAVQQAKIEMINDVMRSTAAWRKDKKSKKEFKSNEELATEFQACVQERHDALVDAVSSLTADAKLKAESDWSQCETDEQKHAFVQNNIIKVFDAKINEEKDAKKREILLKQKETFEKTFPTLNDGLKTAYIVHTISEQKVQSFLQEQSLTTFQAQEIQNQDRRDGRYDVHDRYPQKDTFNLLQTNKQRCISVHRDGINDAKLFPEIAEDIENQKNLYEAALKSDSEKSLECAARKFETSAKVWLQARRANLAERKHKLKELIIRIKNQPTLDKMAAFLHGGRQ